MFNEKLLNRIQESILGSELNIKSKIDIFIQEVNSLMNKQELLLKAINEDRLVITKILEHLEEWTKIIKNKNSNKKDKNG